MSDALFVAYRTDFTGAPWYVESILAKPGTPRALRDGVDWGYTTDYTKARSLSLYWWRRFRKDTEYCGHKAYSIQQTSSEKKIAK